MKLLNNVAKIIVTPVSIVLTGPNLSIISKIDKFLQASYPYLNYPITSTEPLTQKPDYTDLLPTKNPQLDMCSVGLASFPLCKDTTWSDSALHQDGSHVHLCTYNIMLLHFVFLFIHILIFWVPITNAQY